MRTAPVLICAALIAAALTLPREAAAAHEAGSFVKKSPAGADYSLFVPSEYKRGAGATAIVLLHGAGDHHRNFLSSWRSNGFMRQWIAITVDAEKNAAWEPSDLPRVMDVLDEVEKNYNVRRVFVGGFSRGGGFSYRVGLSHLDRFAGILCLGGGLWGAENLIKTDGADRIAVAIVHGKADSVVGYDHATRARDRFEEAKWKNLYFKGIDGLGHRIDSGETTAALAWLDQNADALRTPQDYYAYGVKMNGQGNYARAYWAFQEVHKPENSQEKFYKKAGRMIEKIDKRAAKDGKKLRKLIEADKNSKWVKKWTTYDQRYSGTVYHGELQFVYDTVADGHRGRADMHMREAHAADENKDHARAIRECLKIRDDCYLARGESVDAAKELLERYRNDLSIRVENARLLKGTETWN